MKYTVILFLFILSIPLIVPYFHTGFFPTHDGEWAVVRLGDMFRLLRDHQFPARYSGELNFGYGYPLFNFAYPFPYYLGLLLHFMKIGFVDSIKILFALSVPLSSICMFFAAKEFWENTWSGVAAAALYIYYPYRIVDLYVRGSIGESLAFVLFPLIIYFGIKIIESKRSSLYIVFSAVSFAVLIMTHNIMAVLFLPVIFIFIVLFFYKNKKKAAQFFFSLVFGMFLSAFFWIPALLEKNLILLSQIPITDRNLYFVTISQLIFPKFGYGPPTSSDGFSYQIGIPHIFIFFAVVIALCFFYFKRKQYDFIQKATGVICISTVLLLFLMFKESVFLWNLPFLSEINYPWIILGPLGFLISFLAGYLCIKSLYGRYLVIILTISAIIALLPHAKPQIYVNRGDMFYLTNNATTTSSQELMPLWVKQLPSKRATEKVQVRYGDALVTNVFYNSRKIRFHIDVKKESIVRVNTIYYPGWWATISNDNATIAYNNEKGVMEIHVPKGNSDVQFTFSETTLRMISNLISLSSLSVLLLIIIFSLKKK